MQASLPKVSLTGLVCAAALAAPTQVAEAGPFIDWLLGRPTLVYPAPVAASVPATAGAPLSGAPVTANYPAQTTYYAPAMTTPIASAAGPVTSAAIVAPPQTTYYAPAASPPTSAAPVTAAYPATAYPATAYPAAAYPAAAYPAAAYPAAYPAAAYPAAAYPTTVARPLLGSSLFPSLVARPVIAQPVVAQPVIAQPVVVQPVIAQPVVAGYAPSYRTNWLRVPVTYYRPVTNYNVAGYPISAAVPCNTYTWQAQRVPTLVQRPWVPFVPAANYVGNAITTNYAPAPAVVTAMPALPACQACPTTASPAVLGTAPAATSPSLPEYGAAPAGGAVFEGNSAPVPASGTSPADQAPALLPGTSPGVPLEATPGAAGAGNTGGAAPPAEFSTVPHQASSPYRVTPIPAPDVRHFPTPGSRPEPPPLLRGRDRTAAATPAVKHASLETTVPRASAVPQAAPLAVPSTPAAASPAVGRAPTASPVAPASQPLWTDGGWRSSR